MANGFRRFVFRRGSRGFLVAALQREIGGGLAVDGRLGPLTMEALREAMGSGDDEFELFEVAAKMTPHWHFRPVNAVDLSGYNEGGRKRQVDFTRLKAAGCQAVVIKATENEHYTNEEAFRQIEAALALELAVSLYIVPRVDTPRSGGGVTLTKLCAEADADAEVANLKRFLGRLGIAPSAFHRIYLDVEHGINTKGAPAALAKAEDVYNSWMYAALRQRVVELLSRTMPGSDSRVGVCTARWAEQMYFDHGDPTAVRNLGSAPLWNMSYNGGMYPERVPDLWSENQVVLWQYDNEGRLPGIDGNVDLNIGLL